jgi:hypothetical protein
MKTKLVLFFSLSALLFLSFESAGQKDTNYTKPEYYKVSKVKIFINDESDILELRKQGLSVDHIKVYENYFEAYADSFQLNILKRSIYPYEIIIDDLTKDYLERTKESREKIKLKKPCKTSGFGYGSMGGFYTFDEVIAQLDTMRLLYPNLITVKDSIGSSIEGRPIWAVKISDNPEINEEEPEVFYNSLTHAREPAAMMAVIYYMYYLLENYGSNPEVTYLVNNREIYFVPVINPDGYAYNHQISPNGGGMWRHNLRNNGDGTFGVDLNRNYGYMWGYDNIGSSPIPGNEIYRGTSAFSEPETQIIRDFCVDHNILVCINYHTYGDVLFCPWSYIKAQTPDFTIYNNLIKVATNFNRYLNGHTLPLGHWLNYTLNGDACDWMYGETVTKNKIIALLPEVGLESDGFWPLPERISPLAEENLYANLIYAWGVGVIDNPPYISDASLNLRYCHPLLDTIKITSVETNPDRHASNVFAKVLTLNDSLINEIQLNQTDSVFTVSFFPNSAKEEFYKINLQQTGLDIQSNTFFTNKLRFTTAGPVVLDSIRFVKGLTNYYNLRPFVRNEGNTLTVPNAQIRILCNDPWVSALNTNAVALPAIAPGASVGANSWKAVNYIDSLFPGYFNFKVEVMSDGSTYWVDSIKVNVITGVEDEALQPLTFKLEQNYPNPFNPSTTIKYSIPNEGRVSLTVFNLLGEEVTTLVNEEQSAGNYKVEFNISSLPSGVYFYQLRAGEFNQTRKMILIK